MGNNVKISELPYASRIDDDALIVLVQDHANKVVTVDELSQKVNEKQNNVIDKLWHDLRRITNADTIKAMSSTLANHEYRIDGIEKLNGKQDSQLVSLTNALRDAVARQDAHHRDIGMLRNGMIENRRSLAYTNVRIDKLSYECGAYFSAIDSLNANLKALSEKHDADLAYTYQYISDTHDSAYAYASYWVEDVRAEAHAYTSTEVDNNWAYTYSAYAYLNTYVHFGCSEYWGTIDKTDKLYGNWDDNKVFGSTTIVDPTPGQSNTNCAPGCTC